MGFWIEQRGFNKPPQAVVAGWRALGSGHRLCRLRRSQSFKDRLHQFPWAASQEVEAILSHHWHDRNLGKWYKNYCGHVFPYAAGREEDQLGQWQCNWKTMARGRTHEMERTARTMENKVQSHSCHVDDLHRAEMRGAAE